MKITSQHKSFEWDIEIPVDDFNGLVKPSVIQVNRIEKISRSKLSSTIPRGTINPIQLAVVKTKLKEYLKSRKH